MITSNVRMLARYNAWANRLIYEATAALPDGEATKERHSGGGDAGFSNIVQTLNHCCIIDMIWQAHLEGRPHGFESRSTRDHPPLNQLWHSRQALDAWYVTYSDDLSDAALGEEVDFTLIGGNRGVMTREAILFHIVNHSTYHRGFVVRMFHQIPASAPTTDLPVYFREAQSDIPC